MAQLVKRLAGRYPGLNGVRPCLTHPLRERSQLSSVERVSLCMQVLRLDSAEGAWRRFGGARVAPEWPFPSGLLR